MGPGLRQTLRLVHPLRSVCGDQKHGREVDPCRVISSWLASPLGWDLPELFAVARRLHDGLMHNKEMA